jgi:deoxyribodipyrimidine photo-lyase
LNDRSLQQFSNASRSEALSRLEAFQSAMGRTYADGRNYDLGPDERSNISLLSPFVRSRLVLEEELVRSALAAHSYKAAEKFIQEVFWRAYWKGWLELRPQIWSDFLKTLEEKKESIAQDCSLHARCKEACDADTPYECFNFWVDELKTTGYLHNHSRMWFASIWIFSLELPWQLGAEFFYRHLLDGDPASNTLSWRWVAGLQTRDKRYIATAQNIKKYTSGRFNPITLSHPHDPASLIETFSLPPVGSIQAPDIKVDSARPTILLIFDEDLYLENSPFSECEVSLVLGLCPLLIQGRQNASELVLQFRTSALDDGLSRASAFFNAESRSCSSKDKLIEVLQQQRENGVQQIGLMKPRTGYWKEFVDSLMNDPRLEQITFVTTERRWDSYLYPHAKKGFFTFKNLIPTAISDLTLN